MRPEQLLRFSNLATLNYSIDPGGFNEAGAAAPVFHRSSVAGRLDHAASMRPEQLLRFSVKLYSLTGSRFLRFNEAGAAAPVFHTGKLGGMEGKPRFNEAGAAAPVFPLQNGGDPRRDCSASMRPEQLLRFSRRCRIPNEFADASFNEAGAAAPVFLRGRDATAPDARGFNEAGAAAPVFPATPSSAGRESGTCFNEAGAAAPVFQCGFAADFTGMYKLQ